LYSFIALIITGFIGFISTIPGEDIEELSAKTLLKSNFVHFQNIDERIFTKYRIGLETEKVDVIVMGSSRLMQLGTNSFDKSTLNLSVSGASVEDFVAIIPESVNKFKPSIVYIGADPWIFNKNSKQNRWISIKDMFEFWKKNINEDNIESKLFQKSPSFNFNENRFTSLFIKLNLNNNQINGEMESISKKGKDGLCVYDKYYSNKSQDEIRNNFLNAKNGSIFQFPSNF
jgi:hypothetical protein